MTTAALAGVEELCIPAVSVSAKGETRGSDREDGGVKQ